MIQAINRKHKELWKLDDELEPRIQSSRWVFASAEAQRSSMCRGIEATKSLTGLTTPRPPIWLAVSARPRLAENDVRFIQVHPHTSGISIRISSPSTTKTRRKWTNRLPGY